MQKSLFYFIRYIPHHRLHVIVYFVIPLPSVPGTEQYEGEPALLYKETL